jgi:hypothetical protein
LNGALPIQEEFRSDGFEIRHAGEDHRQLQLLPQYLHDPPHALGTVHGEPPERGPAHEDGPRSQRERLGDVGPAANAAIQVDLGASRDRIHDGQQRLHAGRDAIELAPAVGRDHDAAGAVLDRERRVLGMDYAFQDQGQSGQRPEPRHILPRKRGGLEGLLAQTFLDAGRVGAGGSPSSTRAKRSFLPHRGESTVGTIAPYPALSARRTSASAKWRAPS